MSGVLRRSLDDNDDDDAWIDGDLRAIRCIHHSMPLISIPFPIVRRFGRKCDDRDIVAAVYVCMLHSNWLMVKKTENSRCRSLFYYRLYKPETLAMFACEPKPTTSSNDNFSRACVCVFDSLHLVMANISQIKYFYYFYNSTLNCICELVECILAILSQTQFIYLFVFHNLSYFFFFFCIIILTCDLNASTAPVIPFPPGLFTHRTPCCLESIVYWLIKAILPRPHCNWALLLMVSQWKRFLFSVVVFQNATKGFYFYSLMAKNDKTFFFHAYFICIQ